MCGLRLGCDLFDLRRFGSVCKLCCGVVSGFSAVWVDLGCWLPGGLLGVVLVSRVCGLLLWFRLWCFAVLGCL